MTYTKTHIRSEDLAKIGQIINAAVDEAAKTGYEGGYQECLGDIVDFLIRVKNLPKLAEEIEGLFDRPIDRQLHKTAKEVFGPNEPTKNFLLNQFK